MYTLISAIGKSLTEGGRWTAVEIGNIPMNVLFASFARIYAILSNPLLPDPVSLNLEDIRASQGGKSITFNEMLASLGNVSLPVSTTIPTLNPRYVRYADAFHAGYKVQPIHPRASVDAEMPPSEKTWLHLTRPGMDYSVFHQSCLVSVNGFFHYLDADTDGAYVIDGMKSQVVSRQNQIGIHSFRELGQLHYIPLTPEMVYTQNAQQRLRHQAFIDLGMDVSQKTVLLVLGGYLHVMDNKTFFRVGDRQIGIDMQNLPLLDRFYESGKYLDLSSLPLQKTSRNHTQIAIDEFFGDDNLRAYLTLPQSFVVVLDHPDIFVERQQIHRTRMPGMFISYTKPIYPVVTGVGKVVDYWYTYEDGQYSLTCYDSFRDEQVYHTVDPTKVNSVADSRIPEDAVRNSAAYFWKIGRDL